MKICYVDEAGCPGQLPATPSEVQPVLAIVGLSVSDDSVRPLTRRFVELKQRYRFGERRPAALEEDLPIEVKGSDLRSAMRRQSGSVQRAHCFLDSILDLLSAHGAQLFGRVLIKVPGVPFDGVEVYSSGFQAVCLGFHLQLEVENMRGQVIGDFREPQLNARITKPICTAMLATGSNTFPRLQDCPTFAISNNHAGLQIADIVTSALIYPMTLSLPGTDLDGCRHRNGDDRAFLRRYRRRLAQLCTLRISDGSAVTGIDVVRADAPNAIVPFLPAVSASPVPCRKTPRQVRLESPLVSSKSGTPGATRRVATRAVNEFLNA